MYSHTHACIGGCGLVIRCRARIIRDDCGAHCEAEEDREPYECDECWEARRQADAEQDDLAERCGDDAA